MQSSLVYRSSLYVPAPLNFPPCCYRFNVVASSALIRFFVVCQRARGIGSDALFQLSSYSADAEREESRSMRWWGERGPYYFCVEAADDTLMNLDRSRSPTHSYIHANTHTIYATPLLSHPLLCAPISNVCAHVDEHTRSISRCLIFITDVGRAESQPSTPAT